jgi:hypothetical protein
MKSQAGMNMATPGTESPLRSSRLVRGVVINTYFADEEIRDGRADGQSIQRGVACDVLTYGGPNRGFLPRVAVAQERHGISDHDLWIPRPTTKDLSTGAAPVFARSPGERAGNPADFDGDHVLVEFIEGSAHQAVITKAIAHPRATYRPVKADEIVRRMRARGTVVSVDVSGNVDLDTTRANSGELNADGEETPADDSAHGQVTLRVAKSANLLVRGQDVDGNERTFELSIQEGVFEVKLNDGNSFRVSGDGDGTTVQIGNGGMHAILGERLKALYEEMAATFAAHTHPDGWGSTAPPVIQLPVWGANIISTKVSMPDL